MLIKAKTLRGYKLESLDGEIGKVNEFYFDDHHWTIRYLVADTGRSWLLDKQVLISPYALVAVKRKEQRIVINLTKKQIEDSPSLNSDKPVSATFRGGLLPLLWMADILGRSKHVGDLSLHYTGP